MISYTCVIVVKSQISATEVKILLMIVTKMYLKSILIG